MIVKKLIEKLKKWPENYKVEDEHGNPVSGVHLSRSGGGAGSVWIRFKKKRCKNCNQEIK